LIVNVLYGPAVCSPRSAHPAASYQPRPPRHAAISRDSREGGPAVPQEGREKKEERLREQWKHHLHEL